MQSKILTLMAQSAALSLSLVLAGCGGGGGGSSAPPAATGSSPPTPPPPPPPDANSSQDPDRFSPIIFAESGAVTTNPDAILQLSASQTEIELFLETGLEVSPAGETPCFDASGHEVCAYLITLEATGDMSISGFAPASGTDVIWNQTSPSQISLSWVSAADGVSGVQAIGALTVAYAGDTGSLTLGETSEAVGARVQILPVLTNDRPHFSLIAELP